MGILGQILPDATARVTEVAIIPNLIQADGDPEHLDLQCILHLPNPIPAHPIRHRAIHPVLAGQEEYLQALQNAGIPLHRSLAVRAEGLYRIIFDMCV